jgi:antitoxin PrlF
VCFARLPDKRSPKVSNNLDFSDISDYSVHIISAGGGTANRKETAMAEQGYSPDNGCCRIESVVSVDERGQMVLPKEIRQRAGIEPGDKLAVVAFERDGRICCLSLIKTNELGGAVRGVIGPMVAGLAVKE